jgi:hypothetical protein
MAQDGGNGSGQSARDFLALAHGQEWTSFYESFDKLVQDNLARSSELLKHAMSLPEVADREVAQIKEEMANKIAAERRTAKEAFEILHKELVSSKEQGEALQGSLTAWVTDLSRLGDMVKDLAQKYDEHDGTPAAESVVEAVATEPEPELAWEPEPESVLEVEAEVEAEAEVVAEAEVEAEVEAEAVADAEVESDLFTEAVADSSEEIGWEGDVSFADVVGGEVSDSSDASSPQKPAWLSVGRPS